MIESNTFIVKYRKWLRDAIVFGKSSQCLKFTKHFLFRFDLKSILKKMKTTCIVIAGKHILERLTEHHFATI